MSAENQITAYYSEICDYLQTMTLKNGRPAEKSYKEDDSPTTTTKDTIKQETAGSHGSGELSLEGAQCPISNKPSSSSPSPCKHWRHTNRKKDDERRGRKSEQGSSGSSQPANKRTTNEGTSVNAGAAPHAVQEQQQQTAALVHKGEQPPSTT